MTAGFVAIFIATPLACLAVRLTVATRPHAP